MKNILARVFALWAIVVFVVTMLPVILVIFLTGFWKEPRRIKILHHVFAGWMTVFLLLTFVRRIIKGKKNFKKGQNYVVVCNHNSFMDIPLSSPFIPGANKTIAKIEMARTPLFGIVYKRGSVLVDRKDDQSRRESYSKMKEVLEMGLHMCIYPEGTRNKTKEPLQRFHDGAFRLAADTGKAVLPAVLFYTNRVLPNNKVFYYWPHRVEMHFLPAISPQGKSAQELKEEVFEVMKNYYVTHNH